MLIIRIIDNAVAALDATIVEERDSQQTTSSYSVILNAWERLRSLIDDLDGAVDNPLAPGTPRILLTAELLATHDVHELAFWLSHVGRALEASELTKRRRHSPPPR